MLGSSLAGRGSGHTRFFRFVCILGCIGFVEAQMSCPAGKYAPDYDPNWCTNCEAGKYKATAGTEPCSACPANYGSGYAASSCLDCATIPNAVYDPYTRGCLCNRGYSGVIIHPNIDDSGVGGTCTACPSGKYNAVLARYSQCTSCGSGTTSAVATDSANNCICNAGYYGVLGVEGACVFSCPANTMLLPHPKGTKGASDCLGDLYYTLNYPGCPLTGSFVTQCRICSAQDGYFWSTSANTCNTCTNVQYRTARTSNMFGSEWEPLLGLYTNVTKCISCPAFYTIGSWTAGRANSCKCSSGTCQSNCNTDNNQYAYCTDTTTNNCPPGRGLVSGTCTNCVAGKYKSTVGVSTCKDCGNTFELGTGPIFSQSRDNCVCEAGYGYKSSTNFGACQRCPTNSHSPKARYDLAVCTCNAGYQTRYYGSDNMLDCYNTPTSCPTGQYLSDESCVACAAGTYKATTGTEECIACPVNTFSPAASSSCPCNTGYTGPDGGTCTACEIGKYKSTVGTGSCNTCSRSTTLQIGSTSVNDCVCVDGKAKPSAGEECADCPQGKFKSTAGNYPCSTCEVGKWMAGSGYSSCNTCAAYATTLSTGATHGNFCSCTPGYYATLMEYEAPKTCSPCEAGKFKNVLSNSQCTQCAANTYQPSTNSITCLPCYANSLQPSLGSSTCLCNSGYTGPAGGQCVQCEAGKYKNTPGSVACTDCQAPMTSPAGSTTVSSCVCPSGTGLDAATNTVCVKLCAHGQYGTTTSCEDCAVGKYKPYSAVSNTLGCTACPTGSTTSFGGQYLLDACKCVGQYIKSNTNPWICEFCPAGQHKYSSTTTDCFNCASTYWSVPDQYGCKCNVGYTGQSNYVWYANGGGSCSGCAAGKYKNTLGPEACSVCPTAKFALPAKSECTTCTAGKFGNSTGLSTCFDCPVGSTSLAASDALTDCTCNSGFVGTAGGPCTRECPQGQTDVGGVCTACSAGKYKNAWGTQACIDCPLNTQTILDGYTCGCNKGYGGSSMNYCPACVSGKYKDQVGPYECLPCGWYMSYETWTPGGIINIQSPIAATSKSQCFCPLNSYFYNHEAGQCKMCPDANQFTTSIDTTRSSTIAGCLCKAGYRHLDQEKCEICNANQYSSVGQYSCTNCAAGRVSLAGSTNISQCVCISGWIQQGPICVTPICGPGTTGSGLDQGGCTACPAGKFKPTSGSDNCTSCPANTYSAITGASSISDCSNCPANSVSLQGSVLSTNCQCKAGYTGPNGGTCTACQANFYKDTVGPAACTQCNLAAQSPAGSNSSAKCICRAGYYGSIPNNCQQCAINTYSDTPGSLTCLQCPSNSEALGLNDQKEDCKCNKGYTGPDGGTCTSCNVTQYKDTVGSSPCSPCKANSASGCKHSANCCACKIGYYGAAGQQCTICPTDTYSDVSGASACTPCPANTSSTAGIGSVYECTCIAGHISRLGYGYPCQPCVAGTYTEGLWTCAQCPSNTYSTEVAAVSVATCQACPRNSTSVAGSGSIERCFCVAGYRQTAAHDACIACDPGYYYEATKRYECSQCAGGRYSASVAASGIEVCQDCSAGKWSPPGSPSCQLCPALSDSISRSSLITDCKCNAGATGADGQTCIACEAGTYKEAIGSAACEGCTQFSQSLPGSDDETDCKCSAGFTGDDGGPCSGCAESTYKSSVGSLSCTSCPSNAISPPRSTRQTDCECGAGFAGADGDSCTSCPENTYKDELDPTTCDECPLNSQSPSRSALVTDCKCNAGYTGANGSPCQLCLQGTFKTSVGPEECLGCPADSSSPAGSSVCTCNPGYSGPDNAQCTACKAGEYKEASGSAACTECLPNTLSATASTDHKACRCLAGYTGEDGGPCAACETGTYKPGAGSARCESCPSYATPSSDSAAVSCECEAGYRLGEDGWCGACAVGTFKERAGNASDAFQGCVQQDKCCRCQANHTTVSVGTVQSQDCLCVPGYGGISCHPCVVGSYRQGVSKQECERCPSGSTTLFERTIDNVDCVAAKGYFGNMTVGFVQCTNGTYTPSPGQQRCLACPPGATSPVGAESETQCACELPGWRQTEAGALACTCQPGHARNADTGLCQPCPADHFCPGGDLPAQPCPAASLSAAGSAERTDCVCAAGHSGEDGEPCAACAEGTWKAANGSAACTQCAQYTLSPTASTDPEACLCLAGYTGEDGGPCAACETGEYKPELGAAACTACSANTTTHGPARTDASECVCAAGFGNVSGICRPCPAGRFKAAAGTSECEDGCPAFSASPEGSSNRAACVCNAGYSGDASHSSCEACPVGTYKESTGSADCVTCASNATTPTAGSTNAAACVCVVGFALDSTAGCKPCEANSFGVALPGSWAERTGGNGCLPCEPNSFSKQGSQSGSDCLCEPGFEFASLHPSSNATVCSACPLGKYTDAAAHPHTCHQCHEGATTTAVGAKTVDDCACVPGLFRIQSSATTGAADTTPHVNFTSCEPCPANTFKNSTGNSKCTTCPSNTVSSAGSDDSQQCECKQGYGYEFTSDAKESKSCKACNAGEYKEGIGSWKCYPCPLNSDSPPASQLRTACLCNPGFTGANGGPCSSCPRDTYSLFGACVPCPPNTEAAGGASNVSACTCQPGFTGTPGGPCTACGISFFRGRTDTECQKCREETSTLSPTATSELECVAIEGKTGLLVKAPSVQLALVMPYTLAYFTPDRRLEIRRSVQEIAQTGCNCVIDIEDVFIVEIKIQDDGNGARRLLAAFAEVTAAISVTNDTITIVSESLQDADAVENAFSQSGFTVTSEGPTVNHVDVRTVVDCAPNQYKNFKGNQECLPCPVFSTSQGGSQNISNCICDNGFNRDNDICVKECPAGSEAFENTRNCTRCQPNFYKPEGHLRCIKCPVNSLTLGTNLTSITSCLCEQGYIWNRTTTSCDACPAGSFNNRVNDTECFSCYTECPD